MEIACDYCGNSKEVKTGAYNLAKKTGSPMYCDKTCFGLANRSHKSKGQLVAEKREYDKDYRIKNIISLTAKKKDYFQRTYDPETAAVYRKKNMHKHVEYCRQLGYVEKKKEYDRIYKAKLVYGEFWESHLLLMDIRDECLKRMSAYQIRLINGTLNKSQNRKRNEKANSAKLKISPLGNLALT